VRILLAVPHRPPRVSNLAYRLACLQDPQDSEPLRKSVSDLTFFDPDCDGAAAKLIVRTDELERTRDHE
jgi:hypothetical protein